ncbi:glycosyltransferase [uncultured Maribacter sp.]|uniref:glycosyltransferase n=1 Tax=uncultured Maribacter sp. TaxID=431308 RepID=UPI002622C8E8|nr:glycosyltransferase [uncultured Maribacter sp.]
MKVIKELPLSILHSCKLSLISGTSKKILSKEKLPVVVSLTSIEPRLKTLHLVIKSLIKQEELPQKIILWLNNDLKPKVPKSLLKLQSSLFEIRYSELNCSHRKLIHTLDLFPNKIIVTCDDDLIYRKEWLSLLFKAHKKKPNVVIGNKTVHINHDASSNPLPFKNWRQPLNNIINPKSFLPIGAWGVLYPPNSLNQKVTDVELFLKLAPKADDLWFKAMSLLNKTNSIEAKEKAREPIPIIGSQKVSLKKDNIGKDKNTTQWINLSNHFNLASLILTK